MNERLHDLIDGELGDAAMAETLRELAENSDQRNEFQQLLQLRNELGHNAEFSPMTAREEAEMMDWLHEAIDYKAPPVPAATGTPVMMAIAVLVIGLLLGTGLGYFMNSWLSDDMKEDTAVPAELLLPPFQEIDTAIAAPAFNRDSAVTAIRDSLKQVLEEEAADNKKPRRSSRRYNIPKAVAGE